MRITTISDRTFHQDADAARRAAQEGPVIITDQGRPAYVLLSYADYQKLAGVSRSLLDAVSQKEDDDFEFEPQRMGDTIRRAVDLD